jgi:hypothetical protein
MFDIPSQGCVLEFAQGAAAERSSVRAMRTGKLSQHTRASSSLSTLKGINHAVSSSDAISFW